MIGEELKDILKEVTIEDLRKVTWDYSDEVIVGLYNDNIIRGFMWDVTNAGSIDPRVITS